MDKQRNTDVGIWYCTYYGDDWSNSSGLVGYPATMYLPLCSDRPGDYRTYNAADTSVLDFHLQQIADAKIDFLLFEVSPGGLGGYRPSMGAFVDNARVMAQRIKVWNDGHPWKIRYAIAGGAHKDVYENDPIGLCIEKEAEDVYKSFFNNPAYGGPDNYYHLNGKPLIVYWGDSIQNAAAWDSYEGDKTYGSRFSVRYAHGVVSGNYGWNIYDSGPVINDEVECVSPGWGRFEVNTPPYVYRRCGDFYRQCWETVLNNPRPAVVMIVSFNDYWENTAVWTADTSNLTDAEKWYGHDGQPHPSMYWDITVENIKTLRGLTPDKTI